jgi:CRP-like cAMP-binding protein
MTAFLTSAASPHTSPTPTQNHLLAALPPAELAPLIEHLQLVALPLGKMLYSPNEKLRYAYFPTTSIVSLYYTMESGASSEAAGVGNEGIVGVALLLGGDSTSSAAMVQTAGYAYRLERRLLKERFDQGGHLQRLLLRYIHTLIAQISQTAVCNRHHRIEQQLCRWLLLTLERCSSAELVVTQELVASVLGVRREAISESVGALQSAGFIQNRRGHIKVLDRAGLETRACECHAVVKKELARLTVALQW